jgi:hypothetical protein
LEADAFDIHLASMLALADESFGANYYRGAVKAVILDEFFTAFTRCGDDLVAGPPVVVDQPVFPVVFFHYADPDNTPSFSPETATRSSRKSEKKSLDANGMDPWIADKTRPEKFHKWLWGKPIELEKRYPGVSKYFFPKKHGISGVERD